MVRVWVRELHRVKAEGKEEMSQFWMAQIGYVGKRA